MNCSKNRLSSGVNDPDMGVGSVRARPRDVFGVSVLLTLLLAILLVMWTVGLEDPHGLSHATPVRAADVPSLEPLYGAVQTPWRSSDWSPDGHYLAFDAVGGPSIYDAITGEPVYIDPSKETLDVRGPAWSHAGDRIASSNLVGCTRVVTRDGTSVWSYDTPSSGSCDDT